jgi:hypothetical protein
VLLKDFDAHRRAEREFADAHLAELIQQLKACVGKWPEGYSPSLEDLEAGTPESGAHTVRDGGNPALADQYLAAWEHWLEVWRAFVELDKPVTDGACDLWFEARDASEAAWEQFERMDAQVDAWLNGRK